MFGWVKIHRKMALWEWHSNPNVLSVFFHLLLHANFEESKWQGETIFPGQCVTGREALSKMTGLSEQQIRSSLDKLKSTNEITINTTNKFSIITITNWNDYQDNNQQVNQQITNKQPTNNQQITTSKERKKERKKEDNNKYTSDFEIFWKEYPRHDCSKADAFKVFKESIDLVTTAENVISGAKAYNNQIKTLNTEHKFIAHADTWLRGRRWESDYSITRPKGVVLKTGRENWK